MTRATVTAVLLSPSNPRQLVVGSSDGRIRIWDYVEGKLLRTLELGAPVVHATASPHLPDQLFVALAASSEQHASTTTAVEAAIGKGKATTSAVEGAAQSDDVLAGVYVVSLRAARSVAAADGRASTPPPFSSDPPAGPSPRALPLRLDPRLPHPFARPPVPNRPTQQRLHQERRGAAE